MTRQRSLVLRLLASAVLLAACGGTHSRHAAPRTTRTSPAPLAVDGAATPTGWNPVDDGDAQISVPSDWLVGITGCPGRAPGTLFLHRPEPVFCPEEAAGLTQVWFYPTPSSAPPRMTPTLVHGIDTYPLFGSPTLAGYIAPALGVQLTAQGPLAREILGTLTYSPRAVVLGPGSHSFPPPSWHRVTFGGISLAVPASWPEDRSSNGTPGCQVPDVTLSDTDVLLDSGTTAVAFSCPSEDGSEPVRPGLDGVVIDPGPYGPITSQTTFASCLDIHGLAVCPSESDVYDILVAAVHLPGVTAPVAVEIGLAGTGGIARAILQSLQRA